MLFVNLSLVCCLPQIGLMRNGRLLAENSPHNLLQMFNAPLLEDIILELCRRDHEQNKKKYAHQILEKKVSSYSIGNSKKIIPDISELYPRPVKRVAFGPKPTFPIHFLNSSNQARSDGTIAQSQNINCMVVGIRRMSRDDSYDKYSVEDTDLSEVTEKDLPQPVTTSSQFQRINSLVRRNCIFFIRNILLVQKNILLN